MILASPVLLRGQAAPRADSRTPIRGPLLPETAPQPSVSRRRVRPPAGQRAPVRTTADRTDPRDTARDEAREAARLAAREERRAQQAWVEDAAPELPVRETPPRSVVFHLGPTNSGKTYESLQALAATGSGVYAAPLRQLAQEAYLKLAAQLPPGAVGLSTGEEEVDPFAPIVCCTVEKAPMRGELLVLDESHWVADPDRGHHWARLLLTGEYREMHVISAAEAHPTLAPLVADAGQVDVVHHRRLSRLDVLHAPVRARSVRPQTLVVAFSRKAVYAVAAELDRHRPGRVGVLYGALPPATRREVIDRFSTGELDVLVTTDVIGHGINVPATTVLFAETMKYDGTRMRPLRSWEAAQIAGRAGRYGLTGHGTAGVLAGVAGLSPSLALVSAGAEVARGDRPSDLPDRLPRLRPELEDLGAVEAAELPEALVRWQAWARAATRGQSVTPDDVSELVLRVEALLPLLRGPLGAVGDLQTVWRLVSLPIDYDPPRRTRWLVLARAALRHAAGLPVRPELVLPDVPVDGGVEDFEQAAAAARDAQALLRQFPGVADLDGDDAAWVEEECAEAISELLPHAIALSGSGTCSSCGTSIAPWVSTCRPCSAPRGRGPGRGGGQRDGGRRGSRSGARQGRRPSRSGRG
ncbi:ATP-dependent RNA helicase SUPV3L1/SUV3 [Geodermatophilus normandii]|uniref:ATP-dependent RNA helicase SUPV3L1/SUV3 n=1 Tax=Geodermatophilus normandii TaxID=1137989 RepID=A0A317QDT1_9ACTN|nr:ATP-dependent RNA helicase SUPV3L1/SUV3 [Geodermatophilus normandii]